MMRNTLRISLAVAAIAAMGVAATPSVHAQCCGPQPTVAYSPVVAPAPAPVVYQSYQPYDGWYPGKYLGRVVTWPFRAVGNALSTPLARDPVYAAPAPTFQTAAYRPTYPASYSVGYAPSAYSVGYAPSAYTVGYAPSTYTVGYTPTVQSVARPVTLTSYDACSCGPVCCRSCGDACCGGGVTTAGYETSYDSGCANCASQPVQSSFVEEPSRTRGIEPTPALPRDADIPEQRVQRPVSPEVEGEESLLEEGDSETDGSTSYWNPPQLFDARDRSAQRPQPSVKMWNAVYRQPAPQATKRTGYRPTSASVAPAAAPAVNTARGWKAAD